MMAPSYAVGTASQMRFQPSKSSANWRAAGELNQRANMILAGKVEMRKTVQPAANGSNRFRITRCYKITSRRPPRGAGQGALSVRQSLKISFAA
jgi:hypothetical protein